MDKEKESRSRDLKKNGARFFFSSSPSPPGSNINCNGRGDAYARESCRKEKAKALKRSCSDNKEECRMDGSGSEGEEGNIFRPPLNANGGSSSRKRVKLRGKVADDHGPDHPVDPPLVVPKSAKRLRSAINKRTSQSASPALSDSKRGEHHAYDGTQPLNRLTGEKFKQKMLEAPTKDEEEVAETLISIACFITVSKPAVTKEDRELLRESSEAKATSASLLEAPKEEYTKLLVPCNGTAASNTIPHTDDPSTLEQPADTSVSKTLDAKANGTLQLESHATLPSNVEPVEDVTPLTDPMKLSSPLRTSLHYFPQDGVLRLKQSDAHLFPKQEIGPWPLLPTSMGHDVLSIQKPDGVPQDACRKASSVQPGLPGKGHERLTTFSPCKGVIYPNSVAMSGRPGSANDLPNEKLSLAPADKERQWNGCRTHVRICHLIKNHKKAEKNQLPASKDRQSKADEGTNHSVPTSIETNGSKNTLQARNQMLQDGRLLQAQQAAMLSGAYALQKQAVCEAKTSVDEKKSGQFSVPCPPNQVYMPFTFLQGSYTQYQEQLAAGTSQQVRLQVSPHYLATGQLYVPHTGHASAAAAGGTATKQQQQQQFIWPAHLAHYQPPMGFLPNWQQSNGRPHEPPSSSSLVNHPPSTFPLPVDFNLQNLHQAFILPLSSLPVTSKQNSQKHAAFLQVAVLKEAARTLAGCYLREVGDDTSSKKSEGGLELIMDKTTSESFHVY